MKHILLSLIIIGIVRVGYAQNITIGSGATINVSYGADICAGEYGNITGNLRGTGTQCHHTETCTPSYAEQGGSALHFNGTDDYATIPYHSSFDFGLSDFTIEVWVKRSELNARHNIIERNANDNVITFYIGDDNKVYGTTYETGNSTGVVSNTTVGTSWTHLAFVRTGTTHALYINGALDNSLVGTVRNFNVNADFNIGRWPGGGNYFNGSMDELRIWNTSLTATEIKANLYREICPGMSLVLYYNMNEGSGSSLTDLSENNFTATLHNTTAWVNSGAFSGSKNALVFDGVDDYVLIPDNNILDVDRMTIEMGCKWQGSSVQFLISKGMEQMEIHTTPASGLRFIPTTGVYLDTDPGVLTLGQWHHIAFVYDPSTELAQFFIDGIEKQLTLSNGNVSTAVYSSAVPVSLARRSDNSYKFAGQIDEVRIWNNVRSQAEIQEGMVRVLTGSEAGLAGYYRMDYNDGSILFDISTNNNNGTLINMDPSGAWVTSGAFNTWIGDVNNEWSTAENWSDGLPSTDQNIGLFHWDLGFETTTNTPVNANNLVVASTASPFLGGSLTVSNNLLIKNNVALYGNNTLHKTNALLVDTGMTLSISAGVTLEVSGNLSNHNGTSGVVLESDATGTGKLVNNTTGVKATVKQFVKEDDWHYMGFPFAESPKALVLKGLWVIGNDESAATNNTVSGWTYLDTSSVMVACKGYGIYHDLDTTITMTGTLNTGDKVVNTTCGNEGWNFIANPYPCTIDWDQLKTTGLENVNDAIYVWDPTSGSYASYVDGTPGGASSQNQHIAPMQGFFVKATAAGSVNLTNAAKTSVASTFKSATVQSIIRLALSDAQGRKDESVIRLHPDATNEFDGHFDAYKLKATTSLTPQLYSVYNGAEYSINSIPEVSDKTVVPLELMIKQTGRHTLALTELLNYNEILPIVLFNSQGNELVNLLNNSYHFDAKQGDILKFKLAFGYLLASPEIDILNNLHVRVKNRNVEISGLGDKVSEIGVYTTKGQLLQSHKVQGDALIIGQLPHGVHLLKVTGPEGGVQVKKVVIQ
jgi:hypothetical protein